MDEIGILFRGVTQCETGTFSRPSIIYLNLAVLWLINNILYFLLQDRP